MEDRIILMEEDRTLKGLFIFTVQDGKRIPLLFGAEFGLLCALEEMVKREHITNVF